MKAEIKILEREKQRSMLGELQGDFFYQGRGEELNGPKKGEGEGGGGGKGE